MSDYNRFPPQGITPPADIKPMWVHWARVILITFGPLIAVLWFVFTFIQPRIIEITRGLP